jgi:hypothetical protein
MLQLWTRLPLQNDGGLEEDLFFKQDLEHISDASMA